MSEIVQQPIGTFVKGFHLEGYNREDCFVQLESGVPNVTYIYQAEPSQLPQIKQSSELQLIAVYDKIRAIYYPVSTLSYKGAPNYVLDRCKSIELFKGTQIGNLSLIQADYEKAIKAEYTQVVKEHLDQFREQPLNFKEILRLSTDYLSHIAYTLYIQDKPFEFMTYILDNQHLTTHALLYYLHTPKEAIQKEIELLTSEPKFLDRLYEILYIEQEIARLTKENVDSAKKKILHALAKFKEAKSFKLHIKLEDQEFSVKASGDLRFCTRDLWLGICSATWTPLGNKPMDTSKVDWEDIQTITYGRHLVYQK